MYVLTHCSGVRHGSSSGDTIIADNNRSVFAFSDQGDLIFVDSNFLFVNSSFHVNDKPALPGGSRDSLGHGPVIPGSIFGDYHVRSTSRRATYKKSPFSSRDPTRKKR